MLYFMEKVENRRSVGGSALRLPSCNFRHLFQLLKLRRIFSYLSDGYIGSGVATVGGVLGVTFSYTCIYTNITKLTFHLSYLVRLD